jgi:hypothetical protein
MVKIHAIKRRKNWVILAGIKMARVNSSFVRVRDILIEYSDRSIEGPTGTDKQQI